MPPVLYAIDHVHGKKKKKKKEITCLHSFRLVFLEAQGCKRRVVVSSHPPTIPPPTVTTPFPLYTQAPTTSPTPQSSPSKSTWRRPSTWSWPGPWGGSQPRYAGFSCWYVCWCVVGGWIKNALHRSIESQRTLFRIHIHASKPTYMQDTKAAGPAQVFAPILDLQQQPLWRSVGYQFGGVSRVYTLCM